MEAAEDMTVDPTEDMTERVGRGEEVRRVEGGRREEASEPMSESFTTSRDEEGACEDACEGACEGACEVMRDEAGRKEAYVFEVISDRLENAPEVMVEIDEAWEELDGGLLAIARDFGERGRRPGWR